MKPSLYSVDAPLPAAFELVGKDFQLIVDGKVYLTSSWKMSYFSAKILSLMVQDPCLRSYTLSFSAKKEDVLALIQYIESYSVYLTNTNIEFMWHSACEFESMELLKLVSDFLFPLMNQKTFMSFFVQNTPVWTIPHIVKYVAMNPGLIQILIEKNYSVEIIEEILRSLVNPPSQFVFDCVSKIVNRSGPEYAYLYSLVDFKFLPPQSVAYVASIPGVEISGPLWRCLANTIQASKSLKSMNAGYRFQQTMLMYNIPSTIKQAHPMQQPQIIQQNPAYQQAQQQQTVQKNPVSQQVQQPQIIQQNPVIQQPQQPIQAKPIILPPQKSTSIPEPKVVEDDNEYEEEEEEESEENNEEEQDNEDMGVFEVEPNDVPFIGEPLQGIFNYISDCLGSPVVYGICAMEGGGGRQKALKYLIDMKDHERWWCNKFGKESRWEDAWFTISFLKHAVKLTNYTLHCFIGQPFCAQPKSWVIYGANRERGEDWTILDKEENVKGMNCKNAMMTFSIPRKNQGIYTDYKVVCKENFTKHEDGKFFLTKIEFFGSLLYQE